MSLKHAILGFLSFQSLTGYDLKKALDRSIHHFWQADQSQIYRVLSRLDKERYVTVEVIEQSSRPDMKKYHITSDGREELIKWLGQPLADHDVREPFLIQVFFSGLLDKKMQIEIFTKAIQSLEERIETMRFIYSQLAEEQKTVKDSRTNFFPLLTLEYGILSNKQALDWLNTVLTRIKKNDYSINRDFL